MPSRDLTVKEVDSRRSLRRFIAFPYRIYRNDPYWVAPLRREVKKQLFAHPFHKNADSRYFIALRNGKLVGRIAAILNHRYNQFHASRDGFFGYFECFPDEEAAHALLNRVVEVLGEGGVRRVFGPASPSSNGEFGLLVKGFEDYPCIMMPYHKPYYGEYIESFGFKKAKDLFAYELRSNWLDQRGVGIAERFAERAQGVRIRKLDMSRLEEEAELIRKLYNQVWERNWGFVPLTEEEFAFEVKQLKRIVDPELVLLGEVNGEAVAFGLSVPDFNMALRHANGRLFPFGVLPVLYYSRRITRLRTILLGVKKDFRGKGLDVLLYWETIRRGLARGYRIGECSWILEDNSRIAKPMEKLGARVSKVYRVYGLNL